MKGKWKGEGGAEDSVCAAHLDSRRIPRPTKAKLLRALDVEEEYTLLIVLFEICTEVFIKYLYIFC